MPRATLRPLSLVAILGLVVVVVGAQAPGVDSTDAPKITAQVVVQLLERGHMAKPKIDDETAKKWCETFLKDLDPQKNYFLKGDIDRFMAEALTLDDKVREGNLDFAKEVVETYTERSNQRLETVIELLKEKPDFTIDETIDDDPDRYDYPLTNEAARERWRKKIKLDLLQLKIAEKIEGEAAAKKVLIRYRDRNRIVRQFDINEILEIYLTALTKTFDPHSSYMSDRTLEDTINQSLHLSLDGIGASLQSENGYAVVKEIVPGMAADKDERLQPEDKILGVETGEGEEIDFFEKKLGDVVRHIRGPRGSKVRLIVEPAGTKDRVIYELTRQKIDLNEQHAKGDLIETEADGKPIKVGVINLPAFYGDTQALMKGDPNAVSATKDCRKLLEEFNAKHADAVVIDLRGNGGGLLNEAISLSGLFIDQGPVVQVRDASGVRHLDDDEEGTAWEGPMIVLIDHASASASEIFAGVIRDYGRGLIIGDSSTFGKGTVQSIVPINEQLRDRRLPKLGALKLTIQQFYRANGDSTQVKGVPPHIHIPSIRDKADFGEGKMDNALAFDKIAGEDHQDYKKVPDELVAALGVRSVNRRKVDPKFIKQEERIKKYAERKERHNISLNEANFRAEFVPDEEGEVAGLDEEGNPVKVKDKEGEKKKKYTERPAWDADDYYNQEVMRIVADYLTLGSKVLVSAPPAAGR